MRKMTQVWGNATGRKKSRPAFHETAWWSPQRGRGLKQNLFWLRAAVRGRRRRRSVVLRRCRGLGAIGHQPDIHAPVLLAARSEFHLRPQAGFFKLSCPDRVHGNPCLGYDTRAPHRRAARRGRAVEERIDVPVVPYEAFMVTRLST